MKKILYIITQSNLGGAQKYVLDLATGLKKQDFNVAVAAGGDGELFRRLQAAGIKIFKLKWLRRGAFNPILDLFGLWEIIKLVKRERPDIIHLNSSKAGFSGSLAGKMAGAKVIYTVHGAVFEAAFSWLERKLFLWLERLTAKCKDRIICVSEHDRQLWLKYKVAPPEKLVTIHNGIGAIDFLPKEQARHQFSLRYNRDLDDYQIIGWNGWFYPEKNLATLTKAANLIFGLPAYQNKKIIFLIFGNGPEGKSLKMKVKDLKLENKILFPGAITQGSRYLKAFDVFALPSLKEGLPYTILEAMAAGLPIVASNVGGIPEAIFDGVSGFLIKPRDHEALAERILQILENPDLANRFSQASLEKIKEFSLEKMLSQTQAQYI